MISSAGSNIGAAALFGGRLDVGKSGESNGAGVDSGDANGVICSPDIISPPLPSFRITGK
jgi:hypothetical protein